MKSFDGWLCNNCFKYFASKKEASKLITFIDKDRRRLHFCDGRCLDAFKKQYFQQVENKS